MTVIIPMIIYNNVKTSENSYLFFVMLVSVIATMITILVFCGNVFAIS